MIGTENRYRQNGTAEKLRGAVYTPPPVAAAMVRWAVHAATDRVLDPSCGDGVFLSAVRGRLADLGQTQPCCTGVDIDPQTAAEAGAFCGDFFAWCAENLSARFDAVVGNPPFIRSHLFPEESRSLAFRQMQQMGLRPSRLMSTWAPFVALSCGMLAPGGRLALVLPEELLHVHYAAELRNFLLQQFRRVLVCVPDQDVFSTVQQSVVLLLCDHERDGPGGLLKGSFAALERGPPYEAHAAPGWDWLNKWTHLFLNPSERAAMADFFTTPPWKPLSDYGRVEVGVVTGSNGFFIVSEAQRRSFDSPESLVPVLTSARHLRGIEVTDDDFRSLTERGTPSFLLHTSAPSESLSPALQGYLREGIASGINRRFKCRTREPWYAVPSVRNAHALLLRQAGDMPKMVHLAFPCTCTDTIHRITWKRPEEGRRHVAGFLNVWTLLACELTGRSYGGGVLELMPGEANRLVVPPPLAALDGVFARVDRLMRERAFHDAVEVVSTIVKPETLSPKQYLDAFDILDHLVCRRKRKSQSLEKVARS